MFKYILPIWVSMLINTLLSLTDMFFLKSININYITAIGIAVIPYSILSILLTGLGIAANRYTASGKTIDILKIISICVLFTLIICILANSISNFIFFSANQSVKKYIIEYFNIYIYTLIPLGIMYITTGILRGSNKATISVYFNISAVILNAILDWFFIKITFKSNACFACGIASLLSDSIIAIAYIVLLKLKYKTNNNILDTKQFFVSSYKFSLEKLFSTASIMLISSVFITFLDTSSSNIYFGTDKLFLPTRMFTYSFFEWVIFSESKKTKRNPMHHNIILIFFSLFTIFLSIIYFSPTLNQEIFIILFAINEILFINEREIVAVAFSRDYVDIANMAMFIKALMLVCLMFLLTITKTISLIPLGITQIISTVFAIFLIRIKLYKICANRPA